MNLTCPSCETRYQVDEAAIDRAAGRQVRCANCGYLWHFAPSLEEHLPVEAPPARAAVAPRQGADGEVLETDAASALSTPLDLGSAAAPALVTHRHGQRALLQLGALLVVATVVLVPILGRNTVVQTWPDAVKVYDAVGLKTAAPGAGLEITVRKFESEGSFLISGEITNATGQAIAVPPLRVVLRDNTRKDVEVQIIDPPVEDLPPGGVAHFMARFEHPSVTATDAAVTFEPR